jgi:hypothetical protein
MAARRGRVSNYKINNKDFLNFAKKNHWASVPEVNSI